MASPIRVVDVSPADVKQIIEERLNPALEGVPTAPAISALAMFMALQLKPDLTGREQAGAVEGVLGWLVTYLSSISGPEEVVH